MTRFGRLAFRRPLTDVERQSYATLAASVASTLGDADAALRLTTKALLLSRLQALPEGAGSVLDGSLVYVTSCTSWGKLLSVDEWPVLLAGKAGGALAGNLHAREQGQNLSQILFSIANPFGADVTQLGAGEGLVTTGVSGLTA